MPSEESLVNQVRNLLWRRGDKALEIARQEMLQEEMWFEPLGEALRYFMEDFWEDVLHPALLSLACEAVGGKQSRM